MAKNQVIGKLRILINGVLLDTAGDSTFEPGGVNREPVEGDFIASAFKQGAPKPSKLDVSVLTNGRFGPTAIAAIEDATINIASDNGKAWVMRSAYSEGAPPVTSSDGKAKVVFYGDPAEEVR